MRDFAAQGAVFAGLMQTLREGTFVHAYLISGMRGVGKHTLARLMAQYILCRGDKGDEPCGVCPSCVRMLDGTHPDVVRLLPEKDKKSIVVDQVRELVALAGEHTYEGGRRILLIEQAEKMNPQAQNALLKTLEEPAGGERVPAAVRGHVPAAADDRVPLPEHQAASVVGRGGLEGIGKGGRPCRASGRGGASSRRGHRSGARKWRRIPPSGSAGRRSCGISLR